MQIIEVVAKEWENSHPDLAPLKRDIFIANGNDANLDNNDDDGDGAQDANTGTEVRIGIGDISRAGGGPFYRWGSTTIFDHTTHQNGLSIDIRYVRNNNTEGQVDVSDTGNNGTAALFDQQLTEALINLFIQRGGRIIVSPQTGIPETSNIIWDRTTTEHRNHMHVDLPIVNLPTGAITLRANTSSIVADGVSTVQITSEPIRDRYGFLLLPGILINVRTTNGTIVDGQNIQVDEEGRITFTLRSSTITGEVMITARSVEGDAAGTITINFTP